MRLINHDTTVSFTDDAAPMKSLAEVMGPALSQVARKTGSAATLAPIWARVVGEVVGKHTHPVRLDGSTLLIKCDAPAWRDALEPEKPALLARLQAALGESQIRAIVFEV